MDRRPDVGGGALEVVPDLAVEVLSPKTRDNDLGVKRQLYMSSGVRELWLVDPPAKTVTRVSADGREATLRAGDSLTSEMLPGFGVPLASVFIV